jgi:hypothetical protein
MAGKLTKINCPVYSIDVFCVRILVIFFFSADKFLSPGCRFLPVAEMGQQD